jgi:hypothetical protein
MLVPKMAVKPGNVVWRFEMTDEVVKTPAAVGAPPAGDVAAAVGGDQTAAAPAADEKRLKADRAAAKEVDNFKVEDWAAGRMLVLADLASNSPIFRNVS